MGSALDVSLTANTAQFQSEMTKAAQVAENELKRIGRQTAYATAVTRDMAKAQKEAGSMGAAEIRGASHAMEGFSFATAGAKRELLVLAHELSQGNYSRFGGSMLVLGERTGAAALLFSGMGIATLGVVAALGSFAVAAFKGHTEQDELNKSLQLSGNFAGQTSSSFDALAKSVAASTGTGLGRAREALQGLVASGQIGPRVLGQMTTAVELVARSTGSATDEVVKDFAKMSEAPAKWAEEHNRAWHFISAEQYAYIKRLEEQGKTEEAELVVAKAVTAHLSGSLAPSLGSLERLWKGLGEAAGNAWDAMKGVGKTATVDQQLEGVERALKVLADRKAMNNLAGTPGANPGDSRATLLLNLQREGLLRDRQLAGEVAWRQSLSASTEKARIAAVDYIDKITQETKGTSLATKEIEKYRRQVELLKGTENAVSAKDQATQEAVIRKKYSAAPAKQDKFDAFAGVDPAIVFLAQERSAAKAKEYQQINKDVESSILARYAAEHKAVEEQAKLNAEQAKLSAEQDKAFNTWFQKHDEQERAKNMDSGEARNSAIGKYLNEISDQTKAAEHLVNGSFSRMEDAIVNFTKTGKLSFSDLFGFMAEEFLRNQIRMMEKKYLTDAAGNFSLGNVVSGIGGLFGFGGTPHANGLSYVPFNGYPAILHEGERVLTRQENMNGGQGGGQVIHIDQRGATYNVGQGVSRGEMAAAVKGQAADTETRIRRLMRNGNI